MKISDPYSEDLKYALDDAIMDDLIEVNPIHLQSKEGQQFNMRLSKQGSSLMDSLKTDNRAGRPIEFAYDILNGKTPRQIELLASVHYIMTHDDSKTDVQFVHDIVSMLKPRAGFKLNDVALVIKELKIVNW